MRNEGSAVQIFNKVDIVSVAADGTQGNQNSIEGAISADGRYVAFTTDANNLIPGLPHFGADIDVKDRVTGAIERANTGLGGAAPNASSTSAAISGDGRYVAYSSSSSNLVSGDTNHSATTFLSTTPRRQQYQPNPPSRFDQTADCLEHS